jgi:hypothetical protein
VALLHPGIRRNPWHRTLQRHFADATRSAPSRDPSPGSLGLLLWSGCRDLNPTSPSQDVQTHPLLCV